MLARKYDNYAWQEQPAEQYEVQQPARRKVHRPDPRRVLRNRILKAFLLIISAILSVVSGFQYYLMARPYIEAK